MELKVTQMLGRYELTSALSNKNAGSCRWCFAIRGGQEHFIKEFLEPKHPETDTTSSPEKKEKKLKKCREFETRKTKMYRAINECSDGNLTRITDFFRVGAKYYMVMPKIKALKMEVGEIAGLPEHMKRRICVIIAHAIAQLHSVRFVHADIKHTNIMFVHSKANRLTAKVIDYDAGFFEDDPPRNSEAIAGDINYFSPEVYRAWREEGMYLTCKMDIFAMGVLFHQYLTGNLPGFDAEEFGSVGEAVSFGETAQVSWDMPVDIHKLICKMLESDPNKRPTAQEVFDVLSGADVAAYTVCHEVDGVVRDTFTNRKEAKAGRKVAVQSGTVSARSYPGYKLDRMVPPVAEGELLDDGTVITLRYVKDMSQTKTVSYRVVHKCEERNLDTKTYSQQIWINDPDDAVLETSSLAPKEYPDCRYQSIDPVVQPHDKVPSGSVITLNYEKVVIPGEKPETETTNKGDKPGRVGWHPMDSL